jgi:hypothetical protein
MLQSLGASLSSLVAGFIIGPIASAVGVPLLFPGLRCPVGPVDREPLSAVD